MNKKLLLAAIASAVVFVSGCDVPKDYGEGEAYINSFDYPGSTPIILIKGALRSGDCEKFYQSLKIVRDDNNIREPPAIVIDSIGGTVSTAKCIGRLVNNNNLIVIASGLCLSACSYVLAGGVDKMYYREGTAIGFHRPSWLDGTPLTQKEFVPYQEKSYKYFYNMFNDRNLAYLWSNKGSTTSNEEMAYLTDLEMVYFGIKRYNVTMFGDLSYVERY